MKNELKHTLYRIGMKLLLVLLLLGVLDIVYRYTLYPKELNEHCTLAALSQKAVDEDAEIVYLGESSNHTYSEQDTDRREISTMIADAMPGHALSNLCKDACHAGIYYDILRNIPKQNSVKTVLVTVNLRTFSTEWLYSDLETALNKERVMMKQAPALYKRMLLAFKGYTHWDEAERKQLVRKKLMSQTWPDAYSYSYATAGEWDNAIGSTGILFNGKTASMDTIALTCHYIKCFACGVDDKNPRIKDLDKIVQLCKNRGWRLILHILPDNIEQIEALVGPELQPIMRNNVHYIINRYERQGVTVINNQSLVHDQDFRDRDFPTEHYCQAGRQAVASSIVNALRQ